MSINIKKIKKEINENIFRYEKMIKNCEDEDIKYIYIGQVFSYRHILDLIILYEIIGENHD